MDQATKNIVIAAAVEHSEITEAEMLALTDLQLNKFDTIYTEGINIQDDDAFNAHVVSAYEIVTGA